MSEANTFQSNASSSQPKDLSGQAKDVVNDLRARVAGVSDNVADAAKVNASELSDAARDFANKAKGKVEEAVTQQKSVGADYLDTLARATSQAATAFQNDIPQAAQFIRTTSDQMRRVADTVRNRDMRELVGEVQQFAKRQPTLFFGGAVVLGFAALRFIKSANPSQAGTTASSQSVKHEG